MRLKGGPSAAFLFVLALKFHRNPSRYRTVGFHFSIARERRLFFASSTSLTSMRTAGRKTGIAVGIQSWSQADRATQLRHRSSFEDDKSFPR
jgi:hypothetical protein